MFTFKPDFEVCRKLASELDLSVQAVRSAAEAAWNAKENSDG
jgi:uncharacterized protein (DUF111 family)